MTRTRSAAIMFSTRQRHMAWDFDAWVAPGVQDDEGLRAVLGRRQRFFASSMVSDGRSAVSPRSIAMSLASHRRFGAVHLHTGLFASFGRVQIAAASHVVRTSISAWGRRVVRSSSSIRTRAA